MNKDEEYFKEVILRRIDIPQSDVVKTLSDSLFRAAIYNRGPRNLIDRQTVKIHDQLISGVFRTGLARMTPDFERIDRVARKVATGLYYATYGEPLPKTQSVEVIWRNRTGEKLTGDQDKALVKMLEALHHNSEPLFIGNPDVFVFRQARAVDESECVVWHLGFFKAASFVVVAVPHHLIDGDYRRRKEIAHQKTIT